MGEGKEGRGEGCARANGDVLMEPMQPKKCAHCGKIIQPNHLGLVVDCVWRDGVDLCFECNKKEANKKETK